MLKIRDSVVSVASVDGGPQYASRVMVTFSDGMSAGSHHGDACRPCEKSLARRPTFLMGILVVMIFFLMGCSVKKMAMRQVGDALAGTGSTFSSENDPELVREALPFSLKLMEGLLSEIPDHQGLRLATTSAYVQYAYAFLQLDADILDDTDFEAAQALRKRAANLFKRARDYGLSGLEIRLPGFYQQLHSSTEEAIKRLQVEEVPILYWTSAAWAGWINLSKEHPDRIAEIPMMEALMDRALALNGAWNDGAIHNFMITYAFSRQGVDQEPVEVATHHYRMAMKYAQGRQLGPHVAMAESVAIQTQDSQLFRKLLGKALAFDVDACPETRLVNLLMQRRAQWLLDHEDDLILPDLEDLPVIE